MVNSSHTSYRADERSYFSILKREIHNKVKERGFSQNRAAEIDIIVSEMTSNLSKHAEGGEILFGLFSDVDEYVEIICIDNGPGMADPWKMVADGISTTSTLGHGLGSIRRLSDKFDIYSLKGWGTIVLSRVYKESATALRKSKVDIRAVVVAKPSELVSGDGYYYKVTDEYLKLLVADGLGHGTEANKAVNEAVNAFKLCPYNSGAEIIRFIHASIRKTRGIVGTVVLYNFKTKTWSVAGVGNIASKLLNAFSSRNYMSYNGIIGHNIPGTIKDQEYKLDEFQQIVLCSDGLKSRWEPRFPSMNKYDLSVLAAILYKDYARRTDDMSIVVAKIL